MTYTFSASGLPPGLSLVGSQILGTPATPGNYTVTFTVSDGVSSVSNVVSITIAGAAVPIPFWKLILSADCGSYSLDSARAQLQVLAESGSYWRDSAVESPLVVAETGVYWLDSVEAAISESGSYSLDSAVESPLVVAETGVYWLDSVEAAISESGSYSLDSAVESPLVVAETGVYWLDSVEAAIAESGSYSLDSVELPTRYSSTQVTVQGSAGMTNIFAGSSDDANVVLGDLGFDYRFYDGTFRTNNVYIGSNSYLTFGFGSTEYSLLSRVNPLGKTLHLGSFDRSYQNVFVQASASSFRVRYEGAPGTGGASSRFLEITFFSDGAMMVVKQTPDNSGLWTVTKGDNISFTDYAPSTETSFVIMPNTDFTAYTVQPGSYT